MQDVKAARQLASDITQSGAKLYDLLENEHVERQERAKALRFLDLAASTSGTMMRLLLSLVIFLLTFFLCIDGPREQAYIERSIRDIIENTKQALEDARFARATYCVFMSYSNECSRCCCTCVSVLTKSCSIFAVTQR
jgi:predicted PurR-regulated permease PerM